MNTPEMIIAHKKIGGTAPCFIVAELSANHLQDYFLAEKTIRAIKESGADAVKLQTYTADTITIDAPQDHFKIKQGTLWDGKTLYQLYKQAYTPWEWQPKLKKLAEKLGLIFFSSPFDRTAVDFLEKMYTPAYKVASFEITDLPLIEHIARTGKPVIFASGMATAEDLKAAIAVCKRVGNDKLAILKCTSTYPAPFNEINLRTIPDIAKKFHVVPGLSDHTTGISVPVAATALGAKIIEKHFILDRDLGGPDAAFSLMPSEFKAMVQAVRETESALGTINYALTPHAKKNKAFSRSLFVVQNIRKGETFTEENIRSIRPGFGLHPKYYTKVLGKKAKKDLTRGTPLSLQHIS